MRFEQFVREVDAAVRASTNAESLVESDGNTAVWNLSSHSAVVRLAPPGNVSVALGPSGEASLTTWYPIDAALVPVVARRIVGHLGV